MKTVAELSRPKLKVKQIFPLWAGVQGVQSYEHTGSVHNTFSFGEGGGGLNYNSTVVNSTDQPGSILK